MAALCASAGNNYKTFLKQLITMKGILFLTFTLLCVQRPQVFAQKNAFDWKKISVLLYTKNGIGFMHDNIPNAIACIKKLGSENGFTVTASDTPSVFTDENLKQYNLVIFANTNNDVFDNDNQRLVFRRYIEAGGGFVGIHSVMGTERNWTWFKQMLGGTFSFHAIFQQYEVDVIDPSHPSVKNVPLVWMRKDECYFEKEMYPGIHTVMVQNTATLHPANEEEAQRIKAGRGAFGELFPAVWYQKFDGGTVWVTTLGHDKNDYNEPQFINHLLQGIRFVAQTVDKKDYANSYAENRDIPLRYMPAEK